MRTILFPTDFSDNSKNAFVFALHLAEKLEAEILLFHTYQHAIVDEAFVPVELIEALLHQKQSEAMKHFEAYEQQVQKELGKQVPVKHQLMEAAAAPGILEIAENVQPDMIVMGTLGAKTLAEKIMGSVTSEIISQASCPVLAVPEHATYHDFHRIAYVIDFQKEEFSAVQRLFNFAAMFRAAIDCIHLETEENHWEKLNSEFYRKMLEMEASHAHIQLFTLRGKEVINCLNDFVQAHQNDLICLHTQRQEPFSSLYGSGLTRVMSIFSHIPLLAFK
ncbi:MAG: universal stress protein [Bacteroidetes bacterium]|nr:MAG: universal stress protein [Bacteroidota bacterium]